MRVMLAETFFDSLLDLPASERDRAIKAVQQIKKDPSHPGLNLHPVKESPSNFYTARISKDGRLVVHLGGDEVLICFCAKHDDAYRYARKRTLKRDSSGAEIISISEIREERHYYTPPFEAGKPIVELAADNAEDLNKHFPSEGKKDDVPLFGEFTNERLLESGASEDDLDTLRNLSSEGQLFLLEGTLSSKVHDNLIALYLGEEMPHQLSKVGAEPSIIESKLVEFDDTAEVLMALEKPWERWLVFLSGSQKRIVTGHFNGASKVFGGAGTGKTVVALHRAKHLLETKKLVSERGVGLLTYSRVLANDLVNKAELLFGNNPHFQNRLSVSHLEAVAREYLKLDAGRQFSVTTDYTIRLELERLYERTDLKNQFSFEFILSEFQNVVAPWNLWDFNSYKNFQRLGRETQLRAPERERLSHLFNELSKVLNSKGLMTQHQLYQRAAQIAVNSKPLYDHIIIDETQDLDPSMLHFVRCLVQKGKDDIMLCGDAGQSLYTRNHSFRKHGLDVQGRSRKLYINYRTSRQIKDKAERLNDFLVELLDEPPENRRSLSIFDGPSPTINLFDSREDELQNLTHWINTQLNRGIKSHEIVVLSPSPAVLTAAEGHLTSAKFRCWKLDATANFLQGEIGLATVRRIKGLEYRSVAIIGCDEDHFPSANAMKDLGDGADFDSFFTLEKNSLYVAMTRARDNLLITGVNPGSPFIQEILN